MNSAPIRRPFPVLTVVAVLATAIGTVAQVLDPAILGALRRDPAALAAGEWWRWLSPLVVVDGDPWMHFLTDAIGILVVGSVVEWRLGRRWWLALFISGAAAGEIAGSAWDPTGAGASVALAGLIGGLAVVQVRDRAASMGASAVAVGIVAVWACLAVATQLAVGGTAALVTAGIVCAVAINVLVILHRQGSDDRLVSLVAAGVIVIGGITLIALRDIHGVSLATGLAVAVAGLGVIAPVFAAKGTGLRAGEGRASSR